jgi:hypothetical protein
MADALAVVASVASLCSCAEIISNYSLRALVEIRNAETSIVNLILELRSLEATLSSLRDLLENADAPSLEVEVLETFAKVTSQLQDARGNYLLNRTAKLFVPTLTRCLPSLSDPPPTIFILACITYTFLYMRLRDNQKDDQHRDKFIFGGIGFGVAMGMYTKDWENIKGYVAWFALVGLLLGACVHWAMRGSPDPKAFSRADLRIQVEGDGK